MIQRESARQEVPRVEHLKVENFRALRKVEFHDLTPMTVLLGPNGSGKSTVFDAFSFLGECFEVGLRNAWDRRGRAKELKTRDSQGPIVVEIKYRERPGTRLITYHLEVDEDGGLPIVEREWLAWKVGRWGGRFHFLDYGGGKGEAISGETPTAEGERRTIVLNSPDLLAANVLGQMQEHPRIAALRDFITGWRVSYPSADNTRDQPEAGPQEKLSSTGDNLADVVLYLSERHSTRLEKIIETPRRRVPRVERVLTETMPDGRLSLKIKDAPFGSPVLARFASDGTLKMLAYLGCCTIRIRRRSLALKSLKISCILDFFSNWPRNAALSASVRRFLSPRIHRFSWIRFGRRRCGFYGAMKRAIRRRNAWPI